MLDGVTDLGICSSDSDVKGLHRVVYRQGKTCGVDARRSSGGRPRYVGVADTLGSDYVGLHAASSYATVGASLLAMTN